MAEKKRIYPLFIPHAGCRFRCVFCNQHVVTESDSTDSNDSGLRSYFHSRLAALVEEARRTSLPGEVAFYGGTFTALPSNVLREFLDTAAFWVGEGLFSGIRFSTRPDALTPEICAVLARYPIKAIELGVQSLSDNVLVASGRGYSLDTVIKAVDLLREHPWKLGIQLMAGLPEETRESFEWSISRSVSLCPDFVRVYPTLVLPGTQLAQWFRQGLYKPLTLEEGVVWCVSAYDAFLRAHIRVIRMGLHADPELEKPGNVIAGPYHPAFGYLVRSRWWREQIDKRMRGVVNFHLVNKLILRVPESCVSEVVGFRRENVLWWQRELGLKDVVVEGVSQCLSGESECIVQKGSCGR